MHGKRGSVVPDRDNRTEEEEEEDWHEYAIETRALLHRSNKQRPVLQENTGRINGLAREASPVNRIAALLAAAVASCMVLLFLLTGIGENSNNASPNRTHMELYKEARSRCIWESPPNDGAKVKHASGNKDYFNMRSSKDKAQWEQNIKRKFCHVPHPEDPQTFFAFERQGPFHGFGNFDWNAVDGIKDIAGLSKKWKNGDDVHVTSGLIAPIRENEFISLPPLHVHHAHVYPADLVPSDDESVPYTDYEWSLPPGVPLERRKVPDDPQEYVVLKGKKQRHDFADMHHILFQSHGDWKCLSHDGGEECLLYTLPAGLGFKIPTRSGLSCDYEINDVRTNPRSKFEFWIEIGLTWTSKSLRPASFVSLGNPVLAPGLATVNFDSGSSAVVYYNFTNDILGAGRILQPIFHAHQKLFDSFWVLKSSDGGAYEALERVRKQTNKRTKNVGNPMIISDDLVATKELLLHEIAATKSEKICWSDKPGLVYIESDGSEADALHSCSANGVFDRRASMACDFDRAALGAGETLIVVGFNTLWKHRRCDADAAPRAFDPFYGIVTSRLYQHNVFRFLFVQDNESKIEFHPPALYFYSTWTSGQPEQQDPNFIPKIGR